MKKLGKLKLNAEKMLNHDELVSFKGGSGGGCGPASGDLCIDCMASAQCACEISCGGKIPIVWRHVSSVNLGNVLLNSVHIRCSNLSI